MTSGKPPLSDEKARETIVTRLDINLLVEAGAGSGKTESLARRMAAGVAEGIYEVDGMAAVTFTRKAAAELRGRFQQTLEKRLHQEEDRECVVRIQKALSQLERLFTGTIHSFCAHLLRERPVEAAVAPGFAELDELGDLELRSRAWREYLALERGRSSEVLHRLGDAGVQPKDLDDAFNKVCLFEEVEFLGGAVPIPEVDRAWADLEEFWRHLQSHLPTPLHRDTSCGVQQAAREYMWRSRISRRTRRPAQLVALLELWERHLRIVQKRWSDDAKQKKVISAAVGQLLDEFRATSVTPFLGQWRQYVYGVATTLLNGARLHARELRFRDLTLNYGDLLQSAARVLRENREVRRALQRKYRWLFVDEFQDTDPIQAEVIVLLASEYDSFETGSTSGHADPSVWTDAVLRPGSLFIVGDPKQSIYRFRRADIEIYNQIRQLIESNGGLTVELVTSFRATPELCQWTNDVFEDVFPEEPTAEQPAFQGLQPVPSRSDGGKPRLKTNNLSCIRVLCHDGSVDRSDLPDADAQRIATFIAVEIAEGRRDPGDFLVLTWKRKNLDTYVRALEDVHVPVEVSGAGAFGESEEVRRLSELLRALSDPSDGPALIGVLRGPLFGLSDQALFAYRQCGGWFRVTRPPVEVPHDDNDAGTVCDALWQLHEMYRWTRNLPVSSAVELILESSGCLALAATTPGAAEAGDLIHAVDRVRRVIEIGGTLAEAAANLVQDIDKSEAESLSLEPGRRDVVRVMNLHRAKGLEAKVVFLADPCGGWTKEPDIRIVRDGNRALGYMPITRGWGRSRQLIGLPAGWDNHAAIEAMFLDKEEDRLRYVAATRVQELLVVSRWNKASGGNRPWAVFNSYLADAPELEIRTTVSGSANVGVGDLPTEEALKAHRRSKAVWLATASEPSWTTESITGGQAHGFPVSEDDPARLLRGPATGMGWGELVHKLLEVALRRGRCEREYLERVARWFTFGKPDLDTVVSEALDVVEKVAQSELWDTVLAASDRLVEVPFATLDGQNRVLHGLIDLVYRDHDGWKVVDHKTDQVGPGQGSKLLKRYVAQISQYREAWVRVTSQHVAGVGVHVVRDSKVYWTEAT